MSAPGSAPPLPWVGLAGPTASGKSSLAWRLAQHMPIEIVSVDSAQVYRGMDIGTAKPSRAEREALPHHLIDLLDPAQSYSAATFVADAHTAIAAVHARGRLPLLVGGTMLYFHALLNGLDELPPANPALRARLDAEAAAVGWPTMHERLAVVDAATAARLAPHDAQRIQRALEVWDSTGKPLSAWHQRSAAPRTQATQLVTLEPASRGWLHTRIAERFDAMLAAGLVDEVKALRARGDLHASLPSMRCVGYRQAWLALDNAKPDTGKLGGQTLDTSTLRGLRDTGIAATRQLAKRQITWLRSMSGRTTVVCDDAPNVVFDRVLAAVRAAAAAHQEPPPKSQPITG